MRIPSSPRVAAASNQTHVAAEKPRRAFRPARVPAPAGEAAREAAARMDAAIAAGRPIDLEIGCGVGWHPIAYARANPDRTLIAIERTAEKFAKFRERLARQPAPANLVPVHADAIAWITHFVPDGACERVFLLYPNPNPKNAQARWVRMPFFGHLLGKLRPGGRIELRTNVRDYADEVAAEAGGWGLAIAERRAFTAAEVGPAAARTHFERKYLSRGETCFAIRLVSPESPR